MATEPVRASAAWLALREPADAAARSTELVDELVSLLPGRELEVHDLGSGSGSMARWLAPRLPGRQRWVLHDRDAELLDRVDLAVLDPADVDLAAVDLAAVDVVTRHGDITRLAPATLADADLVTASALLDMMTTDELERFVHVCVGPSCPVLITLSVLGRVELTPADPLDPEVMAAFNAHQRRETAEGRLLGPDAAHAAAQAFTARGRDVVVRPSPWLLGPADAELVAEWFTGWVAAAVEQRPAMAAVIAPYVHRRLAAAADGSLSVTVHHADLLVRPVGGPRPLRPGSHGDAHGHRDSEGVTI